MTRDSMKKFLLVCSGVSFAGIGCVIPPHQAPTAAPGSAASIGHPAAAAPGEPAAEAAPAPVAASPSGPVVLPPGVNDCGPDGVIDDGEVGNNQNMPVGDRGGYWYTFRDKKGTTIEPMAGEDGGTFAMSEGGHASPMAARFHGKIGIGAPLFGGLGLNFVDPKAPYDASKYAGIMFWARRGETSTPKVRLKLPDTNTDPDGGVCAECFNDFGADLVLTPEWKVYFFPWKSVKQMPGWGNPRKPHITPAKVYGIQFQVNVPGANYDIYVDDLKFICQ